MKHTNAQADDAPAGPRGLEPVILPHVSLKWFRVEGLAYSRQRHSGTSIMRSRLPLLTIKTREIWTPFDIARAGQPRCSSLFPAKPDGAYSSSRRATSPNADAYVRIRHTDIYK